MLLGLGGCAVLDREGISPLPDASSPASAASAPAAQWLMPLETIAGGREGNVLTGVAQAQLRRPVAVGVRGEDLYIVDADAARIYKFDRFSRRLELFSDLRGQVGGEAAAIYVGADRSVYVTDTFGGRVLRFDRGGDLVQVYEDAVNLARPVGVSVDDANGDVYVADGVMDHVLVFTRDGKLWRSIGGRGTEPGEFLNITAMSRAEDGVYVTARLGQRAQLLSEDGGLRYVFEADKLVFPVGIAASPDGLVYISDSFDNSIKIFREGKMVGSVGGTGTAPGRYKGIANLALDGGMLYVADSLNGRVQILRVTSAPVR